MRNKRALKATTINLLTGFMKTLVNDDQVITTEGVLSQLGRRTYYKDQTTGVIKLGLCYKQVRGMVKKDPSVTVADIKRLHKIG